MVRRLTLLCATSCLSALMAQTAHAQAGSTPSARPPEETVLDDVVVTASRIEKAGFEAPTPVNVLQTEDLNRKAPASLSEALNQLPVFQNSISNNQQQFTQGNRQRTGSYLNLRALGTQRVLVLQDSQRLPPTGTNGGVDASLIPQLLTRRIDIVTGGASAAYGSDAVSGVVNFVIDNRFQGLKVQAQTGGAWHGYGWNYRLGAAGGKSFLDDRLHVIGSAETSHADAIRKIDLPEIAESWGAVGTGTAADPIRYLSGLRFNALAPHGFVRSGPFAGRQFTADGRLAPFDAGAPSGLPGASIGGDGQIVDQDCCTITPRHTTTQLFGRVEYEVTDKLSVYASLGYNTSKNSDEPIPIITAQNVQIFAGNAFLRPEVNAALGAAPSFNVGRFINEVDGQRISQQSESRIFRAGIAGEVYKDWKWRIGITHARTEFDGESLEVENRKFLAAVDAVRDPAGNTVCRVSLTNPSLFPGCVPLNLIGEGNISRQALDYVHGLSTYETKNKLDAIQASLSGDLLELPAGPVSFAVGAEYREQSLRQTSNSDPGTPVSFAGLRVTAASGLRFGIMNVGVADGSYNVKEGFAELNVPILKDSGIGDLTANGAARLTDYSTSGRVTTWKLGGLYDPIEGVRVRATVSRDIRAPTLFELFAGQTSNAVTFVDRLTGGQASSRQISGGNPDLKPEIANTFTVGVVLKPDFLPGFNFSADYFKIKIDDAITTPYSPFQIIDLCFASNGTSPLCSAITRPLGPTNTSPENTPTSITTLQQNVASLRLSGIDFEASYRFDLGPGTVNLRGLLTRQLTFEQVDVPNAPVRKFLGTSDFNDVQFPVILPKWRGNFNISYETEHFALNLQERYIGAYDRSHQLVYVDNKIDPVWYTDLSAAYKFKALSGEGEAFVTINNVFDVRPPLIPVTRTFGLTVPTIRSAYDIIGRFVTVGVRARF